MSRICLCLTGKTLERDLEILEEYRRYVDLVELRADCLLPDERFLIRSFPEKAGCPVILTIRRKVDGGFFEGGEGSRVTLLAKGLAFAEVDRRRNFAYVDIEEDLEVPGLEEVARTFGTRIIRSFHNAEGMEDDITGKLRSLLRVGDEIAKVAVYPHSLDGVTRIYRAAKETMDMEKILVCMGSFGSSTRILAAKTGAFLSYCSATGKADVPLAAPSHISPVELAELYRFREIGPDTKVFGLAGSPLQTSYSPHIFNTVFSHESIDAVYVPFPSDSIEHFLGLARELGLAGAGITVPYKEKIIPFLSKVSENVTVTGACNTIVPGAGGDDGKEPGWNGYNTDSPGFSESLLNFMGRKNFHGQGITVLGAGGAAKAVVSEIGRLRGKCLILNRNPARAKEIAALWRFRWGALDGQGLDMMDKYSDIIIQTTPVGMAPNIEDDPFALYRFTGKETAMDLVYKPARTAFLKRAEAAGCRVLNGLDMLIRQAKYQYQYFTGRDFPVELIPRLEGVIQQYSG
jgi:3-dehydroquinate dehydratase/shikimate dehydrogenase